MSLKSKAHTLKQAFHYYASNTSLKVVLSGFQHGSGVLSNDLPILNVHISLSTPLRTSYKQSHTPHPLKTRLKPVISNSPRSLTFKRAEGRKAVWAPFWAPISAGERTMRLSRRTSSCVDAINVWTWIAYCCEAGWHSNDWCFSLN